MPTSRVRVRSGLAHPHPSHLTASPEPYPYAGGTDYNKEYYEGDASKAEDQDEGQARTAQQLMLGPVSNPIPMPNPMPNPTPTPIPNPTPDPNSNPKPKPNPNPKPNPTPNPTPIPNQAQTAEQFMLGASILVQPVTAIDLATTNVYLPADDEGSTAYWYDLHTAARHLS